MAIHMRHYRSGALYGIEYLFDEPGDGLSMHRHRPEEAHNVIVLAGAVWVYGPNGVRSVHASAGTVLDIDWRLFHEVRAMQPNTRVLNMYLNGAPPGYLDLPESELTGHYASTLTHSFTDGVLTMLPEWSDYLKDRP